ncbi:MAG: hypothetical protein Q9175_005935 [Cornicularia normoerica]
MDGVKVLHTDQGNNTNNTCKATFPFLQLPAEVRAKIYHHHLTSEQIVPRHAALTKRWTPIDLLYVSRTIYNEAFFHLYTKGEFVLAIRPESIFGLATCWGTSSISAGVGLEMFVKSQSILDLIRHIVLEIHWPSVKYSKLMDREPSRVASTTDSMLSQTMVTVGGMLLSLPRLRTIDVSWFHMTVCASELTEAAPPIHKIPGWLRGLKQVRRTNEKVLIRMPWKGPISTEELALDQEDRGVISNLCREIVEDLRELKEYLMETVY